MPNCHRPSGRTDRFNLACLCLFIFQKISVVSFYRVFARLFWCLYHRPDSDCILSITKTVATLSVSMHSKVGVALQMKIVYILTFHLCILRTIRIIKSAKIRKPIKFGSYSIKKENSFCSQNYFYAHKICFRMIKQFVTLQILHLFVSFSIN